MRLHRYPATLEESTGTATSTQVFNSISTKQLVGMTEDQIGEDRTAYLEKVLDRCKAIMDDGIVVDPFNCVFYVNGQAEADLKKSVDFGKLKTVGPKLAVRSDSKGDLISDAGAGQYLEGENGKLKLVLPDANVLAGWQDWIARAKGILKCLGAGGSMPIHIIGQTEKTVAGACNAAGLRASRVG